MTTNKSLFQPDDPIKFNQLMAKVEAGSLEDQFELSLSQAVGNLNQKKEAKDPSSTKLDKVIDQLFEYNKTNFTEINFPCQKYAVLLDNMIFLLFVSF